VTCHTVRGTPANGKVGPELTHFGSRNSIAANTLPKRDPRDDPDGSKNLNLKRWLRNPQAVKPGNLMPNLNLSDADIEALAAYLQSLR
jgi:cytochrome c oxidase subunit II